MKFVVLHPLQTINLLAAQVCVFLVGSPFPSSSAATAAAASGEEDAASGAAADVSDVDEDDFAGSLGRRWQEWREDHPVRNVAPASGGIFSGVEEGLLLFVLLLRHHGFLCFSCRWRGTIFSGLWRGATFSGFWCGTFLCAPTWLRLGGL